jgi:hypothetical protein
VDEIHFLLTYTCSFECDHCFLYCGPFAEGTFTASQVAQVLDEAVKIGTIEWIYFEGGEPFLYYPALLNGIKLAQERGFKTGIVTNAYGAVSEDDAELWLKPLADLNVSFVSISDDSFHYGEETVSPAKRAQNVAKRLGIPSSPICIEKPTVETPTSEDHVKGAPVIGGGAMFRGRAVEKLIEGLPRRPWNSLNECPHEDLESPSRVHVDAFGHVHLCQGLSMGNMWKTPLSYLVKGYDPHAHPIAAPLLKGGPAQLAKQYGVAHDNDYVDECHFCYLVRRSLLNEFPEYLAPRQVYGLEE